MRSIPQCFYNRDLLALIDNYIDLGFKSYSSLPDKELITAKCIELLGDDAYVCIIESDNLNKVFSHFTKFLRTANADHSYDLVNAMKRNATDYFAEDMDMLFSDRLDEIHTEEMYEKGLCQHIDKSTGETIWR